MERFAATLCLSGAFLLALGNAGFAQQVDSEELLGGHENPPVISTGSSGTSQRCSSTSSIESRSN
jgi:hypothetical protein